MLKYKVILSWGEEFLFDNSADAMSFARTAAYSSILENRLVRIELVWPEPEKDENDKDDENDEEGDE